MWMNEDQITYAAANFADHTILGPATKTLLSLMRAVNSCSDGWCYWRPPASAANRLMILIQNSIPPTFRGVDPPVTLAELRKAYIPLKSFRTKYADTLTFNIYENAYDVAAARFERISTTYAIRKENLEAAIVALDDEYEAAQKALRHYQSSPGVPLPEYRKSLTDY